MGMEWPVFCRESLKLGGGRVGICTLWTKKEIIHNALPDDSYAVCGSLYTVQGINPMIKNILAKPDIRRVIVCGADLMKSGEALINFSKNGVEGQERKIIGSPGYVDSNVPMEALEKFRSSVKVVDMRGKESSILSEINSASDGPAFMQPLVIKELETSSFPLSSREPVFRISSGTLGDAWLKAVDIVLKFGEVKESDYRMRTKEVIGIVAVLESDETGSKFLDSNDAERYYKTIFSPQKPEGVEYTYGERLFSLHGNQIETAIAKLKSAPHTRRATAVTWDVARDSSSENPPCLTQIIWNIKGGRLYQTCVFRSHDIFGAWLPNAYALRMLQKHVAESIGKETGHLIIFSNSAHIYEQSWRKAEDVVHDNYTGKITGFEEDENGYFVVSVEGGEIIVQHHLKDGRKSGYVFRGRKVQKLYRQIVHENLFSKFDHAAYIGHELARAERCIKTGEQFVQDEA